MLDTEQQEEIVTRRSKGQSLRTIAEGMCISKTTVAEYVKKLELEIHNAVNIEKDAFIERVQMDSAKRLETKLKLMRKIADEMLGRDLASVATDKLFSMFYTLEENTKIEARVRFTTLEKYDPFAAFSGLDEVGERPVTNELL